MIKNIAAILLSVGVGLTHLPMEVRAQSPTQPQTSQAPASPSATSPLTAAEPAPAKPTASGKMDPVAATQTFMNRLQGEVRAKGDAYTEGGYWLMLWNLVYALVVMWFLLSSRISSRIRDFAERRAQLEHSQTVLYVLAFVPLVALLVFPLTFYEGFYRAHQYGLSNLSFPQWLVEKGLGLVAEMVVAVIIWTSACAILRRLPQTWWAWGTLTGGMFIVFLLMAVPVLIDPLFNTYKPLPAGPIRDDILSMARANGIPAENVYHYDGSRQTKLIGANVSGLFGTTRITLSDNLLNGATPAEIRAVVAHEMGHYVLNHGLKHAISFTLVLLGGLLFIKFSLAWVLTRFGGRFGVRGISDPAGIPLLFALALIYIFLATPVVYTIVRTAETEADLFGLNAAREPDGFAEVIFKSAEARKLEPGPVEEFMLFHHPSGYNRILAAMRWKAENMK